MLRDNKGIIREKRGKGTGGNKEGYSKRRKSRRMRKVYRGTERKKEEEGCRVAFWNMASPANKDREFWESLKNWNAVLSETWVEERGWEKVREKLPGGGCGGVGLSSGHKKPRKMKGEGGGVC